jgi:ribose/xylose/arabinose/galactoside ABC-type transport system permease subunit
MKGRQLLARGGPFLGLALVLVLFGLAIGPQFFRPANLDLIARQTAIVGMAALGMTLVIASAGIDLSVGSTVSLSTVVIALLLRDDVAPATAALFAIAAAAGCGLVTGLLVTRLRVVPFIVTLGMMLLVRGAAKGLA